MITFRPQKKDKDGKKQPLDGEDFGELVIYNEPVTEHDPETRTTSITGYKTRARARILTNEEQIPRYVEVDLTEQEAAAIQNILYPKLIPAAKLVLGMED